MKLGNVTLYSYKYLGGGGRVSAELSRDTTKGLTEDVSQMEDALALHRRLVAGQALGSGAEDAAQLKASIR